VVDIANQNPGRGALMDGGLDRRSHSRHLTLFRVALLHFEGREILCVVREISAGGLSARSYQALFVGDRVQAELRAGELIEGSVIWVRGWDVGIAFVAPVDVDEVLKSRWVKEDGRRQRLPRVHLECRARLRIASRCGIPVKVEDLSQRGAKIRLEKPVSEMGDATLTLPDLPPIAVVIRWRNDDLMGLSFIDSLSFDRLALWLQAHPQCAGALSSDSGMVQSEPEPEPEPEPELGPVAGYERSVGSCPGPAALHQAMG
jgi:hypothetical protein